MADIDVRSIHEKYGTVLYQKGDFDGAIVNYLSAESDIVDVLSLFPEFIPQSLFTLLYPQRANSPTSPLLNLVGVINPVKLQGVILHRAATAIVQYCEKKRDKVLIFQIFYLEIFKFILIFYYHFH